VRGNTLLRKETLAAIFEEAKGKAVTLDQIRKALATLQRRIASGAGQRSPLLSAAETHQCHGDRASYPGPANDGQRHHIASTVPTT